MLAEAGGLIVGTGTFSDEAGPQGSLAVDGTVLNDTLRLRVVFLPDLRGGLFKLDTSHFVGVMTTRDRIGGTLTTQEHVASTLNLIRVR